MKQDSTHEIYRDIVDAATQGSCPHIGKSARRGAAWFAQSVT
jgi:hypothetical protein